MRYIGGKSLILQHINDVVKHYTNNVNVVFDIFAGSGIVSANFKSNHYSVISNDILFFSYVLNKANLSLNKKPEFENLKRYINSENPLYYLNNLTIKETQYTLDDCFIYKNYSPNKEYNCNRMYFRNDNAIKIDIIRLTIEQWKERSLINEDEYFYLLASLINAVPYVANIAGVYSAYLKFWDNRTYKNLELKDISIINNNTNNYVFNLDASNIASKISADLVYIDPPYNSRQYLPNYHILETIARYDYPVIHGISGMREYENQKSLFCQKNKVKRAFIDLLSSLDTKYILISYNNEGLLSTDELSEIICTTCKRDTFKLFEFGYRKYKNKCTASSKDLKEQLYFCETLAG